MMRTSRLVGLMAYLPSASLDSKMEHTVLMLMRAGDSCVQAGCTAGPAMKHTV